MYKFSIFLITILFFSCSTTENKSVAKATTNAPTTTVANNATENSKKAAQNVINNPAVQKAKAQALARQMKRDSIVKPTRQRYATNAARQKADMVQTFPFDIDMKDATGKVHKSNDILKKNGKPTVVLFWLTTCYPCKIEMKAIEKEYANWQKEADFNLVAISTDFSKNYPAFVDMVNTKNWPWEAYNDVNREFRNVMPGALNGLPQTFVFDKNGEIAYHKRKYRSGDEHKLFAKVKELAAM